MGPTSVYTMFGELRADTDQFKNALRSSDAQLDKIKGSIDETEKRSLSLGKTTAVSARGFDRMREAVNGAQERLRVTAEAFQRGEASAIHMRNALLGVERASANLHSRLQDAAAGATDFAARNAAAAEKASRAAEAAAQRAAQKLEADSIKAANQYEKAQQKMAGDAEKAARAAEVAWQRSIDRTISAAQSLGQGLKTVGTALTVAITAPLALGAREILSAGTQYETALNILQETTKATEAQMKSAADVAKDLGADITLPATSAKDAAEAMVELGKAGFTVTQSMEAARGVLQLAAAAKISEGEAAEIAANALNAFGLAASESTRVADLLAAAANASSAEITDIALAMQQASAVFAGAKIPIDDLTAAIGLMANAGIKGSDAGTSLKTFLQRLQSPTDKAADAMAALGVNIFDSEGKMHSLTNIIGQFESKLAGLTDQKKAEALTQIFGSDAIRAAQVLFKNGAAGFEQMRGSVTQLGAAASLAAAKTKGLGGAWDAFKSQMETIGIQIYEAINVPLTNLVRLAGDVAARVGTAFGSLSPLMQQITIGIGVMAAALGPVLVILGSIIGAVAAIGAAISTIGLPAIGIAIAAVTGLLIQLALPFAVITAQLALLYTAWQQNWGGIREITASVMSYVYDTVLEYGGRAILWWQENWPQIEQIISTVAEKVKTTVQTFLDAIRAFWTNHGEGIMTYLTSWWSTLTTLFDGSIKVLGKSLTFGLQVIRGDWEGAWRSFLSIVEQVVTNMTALWAGGMNTIKKLLMAILPIVVEWGVRFGKFLVDSLVQTIAKAIYIIQTLPYQIVKLIPEIVKGAYSIGEAIKTGIENGLRGGDITKALEKSLTSNQNALQDVINRLKKSISDLTGGGVKEGLGGGPATSPVATTLQQIDKEANVAATSLDKVSQKLDEVKQKAADSAAATAEKFEKWATEVFGPGGAGKAVTAAMTIGKDKFNIQSLDFDLSKGFPTGLNTLNVDPEKRDSPLPPRSAIPSADTPGSDVRMLVEALSKSPLKVDFGDKAIVDLTIIGRDLGVEANTRPNRNALRRGR